MNHHIQERVKIKDKNTVYADSLSKPLTIIEPKGLNQKNPGCLNNRDSRLETVIRHLENCF